MENRELVLAGYFKLRLLLNRTNLVRDQKTELVLEAIRKGDLDYRLIATLKGVKNSKYIELCKTSLIERWEPSEFSGLFSLEDFCASYLRQHLPRRSSFEVVKTMVQGLQAELRSLGIPS